MMEIGIACGVIVVRGYCSDGELDDELDEDELDDSPHGSNQSPFITIPVGPFEDESRSFSAFSVFSVFYVFSASSCFSFASELALLSVTPS